MRLSWICAGLAVVKALVLGPGAADAQADHAHHTVVAPGECEIVAAAPGGCTLEEYILSTLSRSGVAAAMAALDSIAATDEGVERDGHAYAHAIGIAAYTGAEEVGRVFAQCTPVYQSGCYHGVIQSYFTSDLSTRSGLLDAAPVNALCETQRGDPAGRWLLFQCAHGMGHGMMMLASNHLPSALQGCDLVADAWERESCYGGAFMENIVHTTMPHHTTGRPVANSAAHDHGAVASPFSTEPVADFPALKEDEPLYPCTALDGRYSAACYQMQTSAVLFFNGSNVEDAGRVCASAPEAFRSTCFQSLGRDVSSLTLQSHERAMRLCASTPAEYQPWCTIGYTKNLVDVTADPRDGFAYCRLLPVGESKRACNVAVGEQIWVLSEAFVGREAMCLDAEPAYLQACRHGAGLDVAEAAQAEPSANGDLRE